MTATPPDGAALVLRHLRPNHPDHWAAARPPTATPNGSPFVPDPVTSGGGRYSHTAQVRCEVCAHTFTYRRLSADVLARKQAHADRMQRVGRRIRFAATLPLLACGLAAAGATGSVWPAASGAAAALLLFTGTRRSRRTAPSIGPHSVELSPGHDPHDAVAWPLHATSRTAKPTTRTASNPNAVSPAPDAPSVNRPW